MSPVATAQQYEEGKLRKIRVLIVGGGATGQVYGYHLSQAGCDVSFYLKHQYAAEAEEGFALHPFGLVGKRPVRHFEGFEVYTRPDDVRFLTIDQIWLCVSSPAIRGDFVDELNEVCPDAVWVSLQPGLEDREYLLEKINAEKLVSGMIGFVAYQTPLPGEEVWPEGIAYWLPPLSPTLFSGSEPYVSGVANLLQNGGVKAAVQPDVSTTSKYGSAALIPFVLAVEAKQWSLGALRKDAELLGLLCAAIEEIFAAIKAETGTSAGSSKVFTRLIFWKLGLFAAPVVAPFPLEDYLEFHFTKVREQSEQMIESFIGLCQEQEVEREAVETLRDLWIGKRPDIEMVHRMEQPTPPPSMAIPGPDSVDSSGALLIPATDEPTPVPGGFDEETEASDEDEALEPDELAIELPGSLEEPTDPNAEVKEVALREELVTEVPVPNATAEDAGDEEPAQPAEELPPTDETSSLAQRIEELPPTDETPSLAERLGDEAAPDGPTPIQFKDELPPEQRDKLGKQDFIQTELAPGGSAGGASFADAMQSLGKPSSSPPTGPPAREKVDDAGPTEERPSLADRLKTLRAKRQEQRSAESEE